ncbi:MAG: V-type ATP synthase subunit E, partial [Actinomycetia bacterium]|nr:V-type ATP synthase subunit E [Actinomycetes bacterium]
EERRRILARANLEIKEMVLTEKRRGIDEAFRKAKEEILKLSDSEYIEFLEKLILQAVEGDEEIVLNRKDKERISKDLVESMNEKLKSKRRAGNIKISNEVRDIAGGFILKGDNVEINYSLSVIFQKIQEDEESEIAKILFEI